MNHRLTVITDDRPGLIAGLTELLAGHGINIAAIDGRSLDGDAILHLEVDRQDAALVVLNDAGFSTLSEDVLALQVEDAPGALARLARQLSDAGIDIRAITTVSRREGHCLVALATDDNGRAGELLTNLRI